MRKKRKKKKKKEKKKKKKRTKTMSEFPLWCSVLRIQLQQLRSLQGAGSIPGLTSGSSVAATVAEVTAAAQIQFLAQELPYAMSAAIKKEKERRRGKEQKMMLKDSDVITSRKLGPDSSSFELFLHTAGQICLCMSSKQPETVYYESHTLQSWSVLHSEDCLNVKVESKWKTFT